MSQPFSIAIRDGQTDYVPTELIVAACGVAVCFPILRMACGELSKMIFGQRDDLASTKSSYPQFQTPHMADDDESMMGETFESEDFLEDSMIARYGSEFAQSDIAEREELDVNKELEYYDDVDASGSQMTRMLLNSPKILQIPEANIFKKKVDSQSEKENIKLVKEPILKPKISSSPTDFLRHRGSIELLLEKSVLSNTKLDRADERRKGCTKKPGTSRIHRKKQTVNQKQAVEKVSRNRLKKAPMNESPSKSQAVVDESPHPCACGCSSSEKILAVYESKKANIWCVFIRNCPEPRYTWKKHNELIDGDQQVKEFFRTYGKPTKTKRVVVSKVYGEEYFKRFPEDDPRE